MATRVEVLENTARFEPKWTNFVQLGPNQGWKLILWHGISILARQKHCNMLECEYLSSYVVTCPTSVWQLGCRKSPFLDSGCHFPSKFDIVISKTPLYEGIILLIWKRMAPLPVLRGIPLTSLLGNPLVGKSWSSTYFAHFQVISANKIKNIENHFIFSIAEIYF